MGYALPELFTALNERGLTFSRTSTGELQIVGDTSRLTDAIRTAIGEHRQTIIACLPAARAAEPETSVTPQAAAGPAVNPAAVANAIRQQLDEFAGWLGRFVAWAQPRYLDSIDRRIAEAVDTQNPKVVAQQLEALRQEVEAVNWAAEILPRAFEAEAKHAVEANAGPAK